MKKIKEFSELAAFRMFGVEGHSTKKIMRELREAKLAAAVDPRTIVGTPERLAALARIAERVARGEESEDFTGTIR